ncbi:1-acyl-sn-glycerol-3-phosphate acyltransferase [Gloeocapsa sp. PCC 73106]|uniref:lysophospholipid acyltransferase family protein n=1 Tax=Gloeocapsa sp. PCC 73106 TaxID=102232 RepID=UPI0002AC5E07|nr:1-acyl-sn-glycerol-3-phosphate acyltransferase [Gloeocapsa sp. PCC 73106]ELR97982.1 1-acyl-sn-glycerol-3-phosphate acyltransferase [Gloeocapsa sp. PCC 73106]
MIDSQKTLIPTRVWPWLTPLAYTLARWVVLPFYFGEITISGQKNVPQTGAVILAPTHRSRWDAILVPYATGFLVSGRHPRFMVTSTEVTGFQGWLIKRLGSFPVDVDRPDLETLDYSIELLNKGEMLVIFPEGGIFREAIVHPLKRGIGKIALEVLNRNPTAQIKILPISIKYSETLPTRGCQVKIDIGEPLDVADYQDLSPRKGSQKLTQDLKTELKILHET